MIRLRDPDHARWRGEPLEAVFLDLDGTLVDSAEDVAAALNRTLGEFDLAEVPLEAVRGMIGGGAQVLVDRALAHLGSAHLPGLRKLLAERFLRNYDWLLRYDGSRTSVYGGVAEGLQELHGMGLRLAVITNKHQGIATRLLHRLKLGAWIDLVIGLDSCERGKPDPQPLQIACQSLHLVPAQALMVGDSANDVGAARAAGMGVVCVPYGYTEGRDPRTLGCDACIGTLAELPALLRGQPPVSSSSFVNASPATP